MVIALRRRRRGRAPAGVTVADPAAPSDEPQLAADALSVLHVGALVVDRAERVVVCNAAGRAMGLVRGDELALPQLRALVREARRSGAAAETEVRLLHGWLPREPTAVAARATPIDDGRHVILIVEDVTEARRVADMRRDFLANVSHELKTPVGALSLLAEALQDATDDPAAVQRFAARMQHEATRLSKLVAELIQLSRLETADDVAEPQPVGLASVVAEALDRTRLAASAKQIDVRPDVAALPPVRGNREQLVTAVVNLLDNAIAYSPEGTSVGITVRPRPAGEPTHVDLVVKDEGIGIEEADLDRVFERFYRADPARSRATGGTGLGLAIVKHIAANHGGQVAVWSKPGHGSTFTLSLPVADPELRSTS
ncbi:MAG TPA: ATP-binding protein [Mycobacteriales bacterium]|nr:ATP-binding protein [Mycobacteriales bacterium]